MTTTYDSHESVIGAKEAHLGRSTQRDFQEMVYTLIAYYASNKPDDSDWVVLPVTSFDAYFGTINVNQELKIREMRAAAIRPKR